MAVDLSQLSRGTRDRVLAALDAYNEAAGMVRDLHEAGLVIVLGQTGDQGWEIVQLAIVDPERQTKRSKRRRPEPEPTEEDLDVGIDVGGGEET